MRIRILLVCLVVGGGLLGVVLGAPSSIPEGDALWQRANIFFKPLPEPAVSEPDAATRARVDLGRSLYFDSRLSKEGNVSCNSCHSLVTFGVDNLPKSPGDLGQLGGRNSPTVLNAAYHVAQFWDGRAPDLEAQAGMPILNPVEMGIPDEDYLVERLRGVEGYPERFAAAFPDESEPLTYGNIARALGAFERTLVTPSPFDRYLQGDRNALDASAEAGLGLFMQLGCTACHNGVGVGGRSFRKFGLNDPYWVHTKSDPVDEGRAAVTGDPEDRFVFKVASLRNVTETGPYFHDGSVGSLDEAVRVMMEIQVGVEPTAEQVHDLTSFLRTLRGELPPAVREGIEAEMASRPAS